MTTILKPGTYRHYKGNLFKLICQAREEEGAVEVVVYQALYDTEDFGSQPIWVRPLASFLESVEVGGALVPRFTHIDE
jgi:hypothetical protein